MTRLTYMPILALPATKKFHSSLVVCQCISLIAPGLIVTIAAEKKLAIGNTRGSTIETEPPAVTWFGVALERWYVYDCCLGTSPAEPTMFWAEMSVGAFVPGKMKSSPGGMWSQAERGRPPKFLERTSFYKFISKPFILNSLGVD